MISRRQFFRSIGGFGALGASTAAYGFGVEPVLRLRTVSYDLSPPQWPADFQLRIAAIADLHACDPWMSLDRIEAIVERTNALKADLIVMLGDYVAGSSPRHALHSGERMGCGARRLRRRSACTRSSAITTGGKTGRCSASAAGPRWRAARWRQAGIPVYENDAVRLTKAGRPFWLAGLGDQLAYFPARRFARWPHRRRRSRRARSRKSPTTRR